MAGNRAESPASAAVPALRRLHIAQDWNNGREQVLRLYYVDAPESEGSFPERIAEQAAYFSITIEEALKVGKQAAAFTKAALARPFTVETRWHKALGTASSRVSTP